MYSLTDQILTEIMISTLPYPGEGMKQAPLSASETAWRAPRKQRRARGQQPETTLI